MTRTFSDLAGTPDPGDVLALAERAGVDPQQREPAQERRRVEVGDVRLERCALDVRRGRDRVEDGAEQRLEVGALRHRPVGRLLEAGDAGLAAGVDDGEVERVLAVAVVEQVHEQLVGLVDHLGDPGVAAVDLVDHQYHRHVGVQRLAQHEPGLRQRPLAGVDQEHDAVDHRQAALDLAAEVGVARGVDDVDRHALRRGRAGVVHRGVLGEDRDPLLALQVTGVHDPLADDLGLVRGERAGLPQHRVDQRGLAVVDVRNDRDVAQVRGFQFGHEGRLYGSGASGPHRQYVACGMRRSVPATLALTAALLTGCVGRSCASRTSSSPAPGPTARTATATATSEDGWS